MAGLYTNYEGVQCPVCGSDCEHEHTSDDQGKEIYGSDVDQDA